MSRQFQVQAIIDAGDISDHGLAAENQALEPIRTLGVPYVWVRGNHDSLLTQEFIAGLPNGYVLDKGTRKALNHRNDRIRRRVAHRVGNP